MDPSPRDRHPLVLPLVLVLLTVLVVAAGVVAIVIAQSGSGPARVAASASSARSAPAPSSASPEPSSPVTDRCVIGVWQVTSFRATSKLSNGTPIAFAGSGGVTTLRADGTGEDDYTGGVILTATHSGRAYTITIKGKVTYDYRTAEDRLVQTNVAIDGTMSIAENRKVLATQPIETSADPQRYSCTSTSFTIEIGDQQRIEYRRS